MKRRAFFAEKWNDLLIMAAVSSLMLFGEFHGWFAGLEGKAFDTYRSALSGLSLKPKSDKTEVVVIGIDNLAYASCFQNNSPLDPKKISKLIDFAFDQKATVVGVDLQTDAADYRCIYNPTREGSSLIWAATFRPEVGGVSFPRWVLGHETRLSPQVANGEQIDGNTAFRWGVPAYPRDGDFRIRRLPRIYHAPEGEEEHQGEEPAPFIYAFSRRIAMEYRQLRNNSLNPSADEVVVTYAKPRPQLLPASEILHCEGNATANGYDAGAFDPGQVDLREAGAFKGKIVLIGGTWTGSGDIHRTSFGSMPGVAIIADAVQAELSGDYLAEPRKLWMFLLDLGVGFLLIYFSWWADLSIRGRIALLFGSIFGLYVLGGLLLYLLRWLWVSWTGPVLGAFIGFPIDMWNHQAPGHSK